MRSIKTTSGTEVALDGDLLAVLEALFQEVTARKELERSFEERSTLLSYLNRDPRFDPLRDTPRFTALLRRMNFSP